MKNIVIIIAISLGIMSVNAQKIIHDLSKEPTGITSQNRFNGSLHMKDVSNITDSFAGTWGWKSGTKEFTLTLIRQPEYAVKNRQTQKILQYRDRLVGYYVYKENGKIVASTETDDLEQLYPSVWFSLFPDNRISGKVNDYLKNKRNNSVLQQISADKIKLTMQEPEPDMFVIPEQRKIQKPGNTFPLTMELTKVK